ncbi:uncharacterized protein LOC141854933 [Brevipalpus obovatus]|uniref:uncharacterized protein LOC141854933 n=1 Tax=Brevipalpus obovatus TaxID=246614 RepID=UPI003D9EAC0C
MFVLKKKVVLEHDLVNEKLLTCAVCRNTYDQSERAAKLLPCNHLLCKICLGTFCSRANAEHSCSFSCPLCRTTISITSGGALRFPPAFLVNQLLDLITDQNCELIPKCSKHPTPELLFCDACEKEFCEVCDPESHVNHCETSREHFIVPSSFAIKGASKKFTTEAKACISMLDRAEKNISSEMRVLNQTLNNILEDIDLKFTKIVSSVEKRRKEVEASARKIHSTKWKILQDQMKIVQAKKAEVEAKCGKIREEGSIDRINRKVNELSVQKRSFRSSLHPKENWFIRCENMEESTINLVQVTIQSIGFIRTSTTCPSLCEVNIGKCFAQMDTSAEVITYGYSGERQRCGGDIVRATLKASEEDPEIPVSVVDKDDGSYELKFTPPKSTIYHLSVEIFDHPIKTYPLKFEAQSYENYFLSCGWAQESPSNLPRVPNKIKHLPLLGRGLDRKIRCATSLSLSSRVWVCASSSSSSQVYVVDSRGGFENSSESFEIQNNILCAASVAIIPIGHVFDYDKIDATDVELIDVNLGQSARSSLLDGKRNQKGNKSREKRPSKRDQEPGISKKPAEINESQQPLIQDIDGIIPNDSTSSPSSEQASTDPLPVDQSPEGCLPSSSSTNEEVDSRGASCVSQTIPTVWLGGMDADKNGNICIYDEKDPGTGPLASIKLPSPVVQIIHHRGKVFVASVDGRCYVFASLQNDGFWDLTKYFYIDMKEKSIVLNGHSQIADGQNTSSGVVVGPSNRLSFLHQNFSIRCMEIVGTSVWLAYRNSVYILDWETMKIISHFKVDSNEKARVTQITSAGNGVWCSTQLDSRIHLYSACPPFQHIQCINAEPHIMKPPIPNYFDFGKIITMKASHDRLWIGTNRGVILNIPYEHQTSSPGSSSNAQIPKCDEARKQLSLHRHTEIVNFFIQMENLMISGGEGYDDRLLDLGENEEIQADKQSHLIVWRQNFTSPSFR